MSSAILVSNYIRGFINYVDGLYDDYEKVAKKSVKYNEFYTYLNGGAEYKADLKDIAVNNVPPALLNVKVNVLDVFPSSV
jgi:hypothetical protein